jgi:hypothetical protein
MIVRAGLHNLHFNVRAERDKIHAATGRLASANEMVGEEGMKRHLAEQLLTLALVAAGWPALAHHSFAMFDQDNPTELEGLVVEFKFTNPHTFILLQVKQKEGEPTTWNLEGGSPSALVRDGWSSKTIKPGDELKMTIWPLRSGAPGGAWNVNKIKYKDGQPIAVTR